MEQKNMVVLISASKLNESLVPFVLDLIENEFQKILILLDDTEKQHQQIKELKALDTVKVLLVPPSTRGLKRGYERLIAHFPDVRATIIVGEEEKYTVEDVHLIAERLIKYPDDFILGIRKYQRENISSKTKIGRNVIRFYLNLIERRKISESITSLRAFSIENLRLIVENVADDFQKNSGMIFIAKSLDIKFQRVQLHSEEVIIDPRSFKELFKEVFRPYRIFLKFMGASLFSTIIDLSLFILMIDLFRENFPLAYILIATIIARSFSLLVNYALNRLKVFKRKHLQRGSFGRYLELAVIRMFISGLVVTLLVRTPFLNEIPAKMLVDASLFFAGFLIQQTFVFRKKKE